MRLFSFVVIVMINGKVLISEFWDLLKVVLLILSVMLLTVFIFAVSFWLYW